MLKVGAGSSDRMKIIIAGAGRIGGSIAEVLSREGYDLSIIDVSAETIEHVSNDVDALCIEGSATSPEVLCDAGAEEADILLAVTELDEVNMVCAAAARKLGTKSVVARVRDPEYLGKSEFLENVFGISFIVNPEYECALEISRILKFPGAVRVDTFSKGKIEIVEHVVPSGGKLAGVCLKNLKKLFDSDVLVSLAERGGKVTIPNGEFVIQPNDKLSLTGNRDELQKFFINIGAYRKPVKSAVIVGGNRTGVYLSKLLIKNGISVSIVEKNREVCDAIYDIVPSARIICGDATKSEVLLEERIGEKDAFIALTGDDGDNIITSIYAKHCGTGKVITKVDHEHFAEVLGSSDLDCFITPKNIIVTQLTRYVRAVLNSEENAMLTLYKLADGKAEAVEFEVNEKSKCIGKPLRELRLKKNILIAGVIRGNDTILPNGSTVIADGDHIIVVGTAGVIRELKDIYYE